MTRYNMFGPAGNNKKPRCKFEYKTCNKFYKLLLIMNKWKNENYKIEKIPHGTSYAQKYTTTYSLTCEIHNLDNLPEAAQKVHCIHTCQKLYPLIP